MTEQHCRTCKNPNSVDTFKTVCSQTFNHLDPHAATLFQVTRWKPWTSSISRNQSLVPALSTTCHQPFGGANLDERARGKYCPNWTSQTTMRFRSCVTGISNQHSCVLAACYYLPLSGKQVWTGPDDRSYYVTRRKRY